MKTLRVERGGALEAHDLAKLKAIGSALHVLNQRIRVRMT